MIDFLFCPISMVIPFNKQSQSRSHMRVSEWDPESKGRALVGAKLKTSI